MWLTSSLVLISYIFEGLFQYQKLALKHSNNIKKNHCMFVQHYFVSKIYGTRPYLPEDFIDGKNLSTKVDTYSYGIVLFELATGKLAHDNNRPKFKFLKKFIDNCDDQDLEILMDKEAGFDCRAFYYFILLGKLCSKKLAKDRPEMEEVYKMLSDFKTH